MKGNAGPEELSEGISGFKKVLLEKDGVRMHGVFRAVSKVREAVLPSPASLQNGDACRPQCSQEFHMPASVQNSQRGFAQALV